MVGGALARTAWLVIAMSVVIGVLAGAAAGAPLPGSSVPLVGSAFQGADGSQDDEAPYVDWQGFEAGGRVVHSPDPKAADSAFAGGSKEDKPGEWDLTTESGGVNPAKDNVLDAWSAVDQPGADTFLYLAFAREKADGDTFVAFELNRDARLWDNGRARIPCRRSGDVLVVVAAHGKGIDLVLERWITSATDPDTGCATAGRVEQAGTIPAGSAQGAVNGGPIISRLPGFHPPSSSILDAGLFGETALNLSALLAGAFDDRCLAFGSIWMHSHSSESESSNLQDYVAPHALAVHTCAASGVKFFDLDANGQRDAGEPGIPHFLIWADYDNDGRRDVGEPFTETDDQGRYVLDDIQPPNGSYRLREGLLVRRRAIATSWVCSFPHAGTPGGFADGPGGLFGCGWGPIASATTPDARDRDFGNWLPARLTVEKQLWPAGDPGRFDVNVNGLTVLPAAGDGATTTIAVPPGSYDMTEAAVPPTNANDYRSTVTCRSTTRRRGRSRAGTGYTGLVLRGGDQATCTFINARAGAPAIAIEKTGPTLATAGDTLRYTLYVTNPGDVRMPAGTVDVRDDTCDDPPALVDKSDANGTDTTPQTLDLGDTWTYECAHRTPAPTAACSLTAVTNTATAHGTAGDTAVSDGASITTTLNCPGQPPEPPLPPPEPPGPQPPTPVPNPGAGAPPAIASSGPAAPTAGAAAVAGLTVSAGCVSRPSQLQLTGIRIRRILAVVSGHLERRETLGILQRRALPLLRLPAPGRHRVSVRVVFERGSGTPPVTLTRTITICARAAPAPHFTG